MQVAYAEHLSLPSFSTPEHILGEMSARTFSQMCELCFVGFFKKAGDIFCA